MDNMIKFYRGLVGNLPETGVNGALYITTDEGAIYYGTGTGMKRLGDFVQVANVTALPEKAHESCLYYCVAENILAKWNGTEWKQINKQPTSEELKTLLGLGSLAYLSEVSEANLSAELAEKVNASAEGNHAHSNKDVLDGITAEKVAAWDAAEQNAKDYADTELAKKVDKVEGKSLVSDTEITKLAGVSEGANKVEASETNGNIKIDGVETVVYTHPDKHAIAEVDGLQAALDGKQAAGDYATKAEAQGYADAKDEVIAAAKKAGDDAQGAVDALAAKVGEVTEGKTVVEMIADAKTEATYDDTQVKADIKANADAIDAIEADYLKAADKTELSDAIAAEKERAEGIEAGLRTDVDAIKGDYLKASDKEDLQTQINTIMNNPDAEGAINSINEFTQYVEEHGTIAEGFRTDIDKNKEDIAANAKAIADQATSDAATYETKTDATAKLGEAKTYADGLNTAMDTRVKVLEAIDHDAYVDAIATAKTEISEEIDTDVKALADGQVKTNTEAIATLDGNTYKKSETYTQAEVDALISAAHTWGEF